MAKNRTYTNMVWVPEDGSNSTMYYIRFSKGMKLLMKGMKISKFCPKDRKHKVFVLSKITYRAN